MPPAALGSSLVDQMVPVADELRLLNQQFGTRPWHVFLERYSWAGGEPGAGARTLVSSTEMGAAPWSGGPPELVDERGKRLHPGGLHTGMKVRLVEVSLQYTLAELTGAPVAAGEDWFFKIVEAEGQADETFYAQIGEKCRPPMKDRSKTIGWVVELRVVSAP